MLMIKIEIEIEKRTPVMSGVVLTNQKEVERAIAPIRTPDRKWTQ